MLFSMIALIGVKTNKNNEVKMNAKNLIVMGTILVLGLFSAQLSAMTGMTIVIPINETVSISGLSFAALVVIILNAALNLRKEA